MSGSDFKKKFENTVLSLLIAGNAYFIKRLVDEIDATKQLAIQTREDVAVIKDKLTRVRMRSAACDAASARIYPSVLKSEFGGKNAETVLLVENILAPGLGFGCSPSPRIRLVHSSELHRGRGRLGDN